MDEHLLPLVRYFEGRCQVRKFEVSQTSQIDQAMEWADLCWFDWCDELIGYASQKPRACRLVCRVHNLEGYTNLPKAVKWDRVDLLIFTCNEEAIQALAAKVPGLEQQVRLVQIPNAVDLDALPFVSKTRGHNLVCPGHLSPRTNPMLLLQGFKELLDRDPDYRLHFSGPFQDEMLLQYFQYQVDRLDLREKVFFSQGRESLTNWLTDKHFLVSGAISEGHAHYILEAMAMGIKPVIHNFPGAENIFPGKFLYNTVREFRGIILEDDYDPAGIRAFVKQYHSLEDQVEVLAALLADVPTASSGDRQKAPDKARVTPGEIDHEGLLIEEKAVDFVYSLIAHPDFGPLGDYGDLNLWDCNFLWLINQLTTELSSKGN